MPQKTIGGEWVDR